MNSEEPYPIYPLAIDTIVQALSEGDKTNYHHILQTMQLAKSEFAPFCSWSDVSYTRNCIAENEQFELLLLCWEAGQVTPIHNHGGEECWVKIIDGKLKETIYKMDEVGELSKFKSSVSFPNDIGYMVDFMGVHCLENVSNGRSMSLHLYAKPIRNCKVFDEGKKCFVNKKLKYNTAPSLKETV